MKDLTRKILAIIGLVCMAFFLVAMMITVIAPTMFDGKVGYIAISLLIIIIVIFALIYFDNKERRRKQQQEQAEKERRENNKRKRAENAQKQSAIAAAKNASRSSSDVNGTDAHEDITSPDIDNAENKAEKNAEDKD